MEEETKYEFPESSSAIWIFFLLMFFGYKPKEGNFEIQLDQLIEAGVSQDVVDSVKELKDIYEKDKDLLTEQLHKNEVNI